MSLSEYNKFKFIVFAHDMSIIRIKEYSMPDRSRFCFEPIDVVRGSSKKEEYCCTC